MLIEKHQRPPCPRPPRPAAHPPPRFPRCLPPAEQRHVRVSAVCSATVFLPVASPFSVSRVATLLRNAAATDLRLKFFVLTRRVYAPMRHATPASYRHAIFQPCRKVRQQRTVPRARRGAFTHAVVGISSPSSPNRRQRIVRRRYPAASPAP